MSEKEWELGSIYSCYWESPAVRSRFKIWSAHVTRKTGTLGSKNNRFRSHFNSPTQPSQPWTLKHVTGTNPKPPRCPNYVVGATTAKIAVAGRPGGRPPMGAGRPACRPLLLFYFFSIFLLISKLYIFFILAPFLTFFIWKFIRKILRTRWRNFRNQIKKLSYDYFILN